MTPDLMIGLWFSGLVLISGLVLPSTLIWIAQD